MDARGPPAIGPTLSEHHETALRGRKRRAIALLAVGIVASKSLWFTTAAVLPSLADSLDTTPGALAGLSTATQAGFVVGALFFAITGLPDRIDPRRLFAGSALAASVFNLALLVVPGDGGLAVLSRGLVGAALAGVYPVGLKIAVGWSVKQRGLITSLLIGALTLGSAAPHLIAWFGGADWRVTLVVTSVLGAVGGSVILGTQLGPYHARATRFDPTAIRLAWTRPPIRAAYLGYFGHMWELYAFWSWIGAATLAAAGGRDDPVRFASGVTFVAVAAGGLACLPAGWWADRFGKANVARAAMIGSAISGMLAALAFGHSLPLFVGAVVLWGITVIPDSAQFSALVADHAPAERTGSLMTLQTALGFGLTILTVRGTPLVADAVGWPLTFLVMVLGPIVGAIVIGGARVRAEQRTG